MSNDGRTERGTHICVDAQKETPSDIQLHLAAIRGDEILLRKLLDSGKVHVDCKDEVCYYYIQFYVQKLNTKDKQNGRNG